MARRVGLDADVGMYTVPAEIVDEWSSSDITVQEGDSVWMHCNVTGVPTPAVTWHRRTVSGHDIHDCRQRTVDAGITAAAYLLTRCMGPGSNRAAEIDK